MEFVHFACTSEDVNNLAYGLMLRDARENELVPMLERVEAKLVVRRARRAPEERRTPLLVRSASAFWKVNSIFWRF